MWMSREWMTAAAVVIEKRILCLSVMDVSYLYTVWIGCGTEKAA
jgi:hypothetical protein